MSLSAKMKGTLPSEEESLDYKEEICLVKETVLAEIQEGG